MSSHEIIKAICPEGHYYNQSIYSSCPYCARKNSAKPETHDSSDDVPASLQESSRDKDLRSEPTERSDDCFQDEDGYVGDRTVSFYSGESNDPVVGWLVCIKGRYNGVSFNLYAGRNEIGRGAASDISLTDEPCISKKTHAVVIFEPKRRFFYLQSGDSHGLTYLNGELVLSYQQLASRDIITLGDIVFIFVALCGDDFDWNDTEKYDR